MSYSQNDLVKAVLQDLERLGNSETVDADDSLAVTSMLPGILADLYARRVTQSLLAAPFTDSYFPSLVRVVAEWVGPRFGKPTDPAKVQAAEGSLAQVIRLDRNQSSELAVAVLEQLAIWGVPSSTIDYALVAGRIQNDLDDLAARGVIYSADEDSIQSAAFRHVATVIAARLGPPTVQPLVDRAERDLRMQMADDLATEPTEAEYF